MRYKYLSKFMIQYYQFKNRVIARLISIFKKNNNVLIYGPQRSFTNFFTQYLERNFFVNIKKGTAHKNLDYYKHNPEPKLDMKILRNTTIFILYKELNFWIKSLERNPMDFFEINKLFGYNISSVSEVEKITEYHKNFYTFWIKKSKSDLNIEFIDFREIHEPNFIYDYSKHIKSKYNFFSHSKIYIPNKVRFSENYDKKNYEFRNEQEDVVNKQIKSLIKR
jgi:hypothetical protein